MKLYDEVINEWCGLISDRTSLEYPVADLSAPYEEWSDAGSHQMVLRSDCAYELGGSSSDYYAIGGMGVTDSLEIVSKDSITLIGPELSKIESDASYARIAIVRADIEKTGNALYNAIKQIDYVRYHVHPDGFMGRVSSVYGRESIRVSKDAISKGIDFGKVGNIMIREYKKILEIKAVKLIFITDPEFDFKTLDASVKKSVKITSAIDHIMKNSMTDCHTCSLQAVCDEVEGLREMHFMKK